MTANKATKKRKSPIHLTHLVPHSPKFYQVIVRSGKTSFTVDTTAELLGLDPATMTSKVRTAISNRWGDCLKRPESFPGLVRLGKGSYEYNGAYSPPPSNGEVPQPNSKMEGWGLCEYFKVTDGEYILRFEDGTSKVVS